MTYSKHAAMQNATLLASIKALFAKYTGIEGSYSSTLIDGVAHYMLDSGIYSDAFSVDDAMLIEQRTKHLEYDSDEWHEAVHDMDDLQCNKLLADVYVLEAQYDDGSKDDSGCTYLGDEIIRELCELADY